MRSRLKGALLLILAFALGISAGALGLSVFQWRWGWPPQGPGPRDPQFLLQRLDRELGLTPEQRRQVEVILREARQELAGLREELGPRFRGVFTRYRARIREVLDSAQREKFDALAAQMEQRLQRRREGHPSLPPGR
jgi:Spy/CpxP family protein refolding chaperone